MEKFSKLLELLGVLVKVILLWVGLIGLCYCGGCFLPGIVNYVFVSNEKSKLEYQNPPNTIRVIDDNPGFVSLSPDGNFMLRRYGEMNFLENLVTGETTFVKNEFKVSYWISASLFTGLKGIQQCVISVTDPQSCNIPVLTLDEPTYLDATKALVQMSDQVYFLTYANLVYGLGKDDAENPIAYRTQCDSNCRELILDGEELSPKILTSAEVPQLTIWRRLTFREDEISPTLQNRITLRREPLGEYKLKTCLIVFDNKEVEITRVCTSDFPATIESALYPIGWNSEGTGYYFQIDFASGNRIGDVFLLVIPQNK